MKKFLTLTLAAAVSASFAQAQDAGGFRIGVKAGATYANLAGNEVNQLLGSDYNTDLNDRKLGFTAGLAFTIPVTSDGFFAFAPEILLDRKGYQIESSQKNLGANINKFSIQTKRALTYIDVPLLAKINAGGLFFELGPQVGYLVRSSQETEEITKYSDGTKDKVTSSESDGKKDLDGFDWGAVAGLGYQSEAGISIGLRYNRGFNSLFPTTNSSTQPRGFNDVFMLQLGYLLPLGR